MAQRFRGTSRHKVDAKGRVSIPADFRRVLDANDADRDPGTNPSVFLMYGDDRVPWFECYSAAAMDEIDAAIDAMDEGTADRQHLEDYFYERAETLRIDDSGRLILSRPLREKIGITDEAIFKARGKTFRIMAPAADDAVAAPLSTRLSELPDGVPITSLLPRKTGAAG